MQSNQESYRLKQARSKLERLEKEFKQVDEDLHGHYNVTNGQPMNDKRNGASWFKKRDRIEEKGFKLLEEIKAQRERVKMLERREYNKANGLNKRGNGLELSVKNIPLIKEEIAKFERGESRYTKATIQRYKRELLKLEVMAELSERELSPGAEKLVDDGLLTRWAKKPTIYFIKGARRLALELNEYGIFEECPRYPAMTEEAEQKVFELLAEQGEINHKEWGTP